MVDTNNFGASPYYDYEIIRDEKMVIAKLSPNFSKSLVNNISFEKWNSSLPLPAFRRDTTSLQRLLAATSVKTFDFSNWDTHNIRNVFSMLGFSDIEELDCSGLDLSNCINFSYLFNGCTNLKVLDFSNQNPTGNTELFFNRCHVLELLDISNWANVKTLKSAIESQDFCALRHIYVHDKNIAEIMEKAVTSQCTISSVF